MRLKKLLVSRWSISPTLTTICSGREVTGTHSFFLGHPIALAMVEVPSFRVGDKVAVEVRGREAPAEVVRLPFYRGSARSAAAPAKS